MRWLLIWPFTHPHTRTHIPTLLIPLSSCHVNRIVYVQPRAGWFLVILWFWWAILICDCANNTWRSGGYSPGTCQHKGRWKAFPINCIICFEVYQELTARWYEFWRNLQQQKQSIDVIKDILMCSRLQFVCVPDEIICFKRKKLRPSCCNTHSISTIFAYLRSWGVLPIKYLHIIIAEIINKYIFDW